MGAIPVNAVNEWCFIVTTGPSDGPMRMSVDIGDGQGVQPVVEQSDFRASEEVYNECWSSNRHHDFVGARVQNTDFHAWAGTFELYKNGERVSLVCDGCQECDECDVNVGLVVVDGNRSRTALDEVNTRCSNGAWCTIRIGTKWCFEVETVESGALIFSVDFDNGNGLQTVASSERYLVGDTVYDECWYGGDFVGAKVQNVDRNSWQGTFTLTHDGQPVPLVCAEGCEACDGCSFDASLMLVDGDFDRVRRESSTWCINSNECTITMASTCFTVTTGIVSSSAGFLALEVDIGDGNGMVSVVPPTTEFWKREEVYSVCWHEHEFVAAIVQNNELDSWEGNFELTVNGQQAGLVCDQGCDECDGCTVDASAMVVGGGVIHAEAGTTRCSNGNACRVILESVDCVQQWSACNEHCVRTVEATLQQRLGNGQPCLEYSEAIRLGSTTSCELGEDSCPDSGRCISFGHNKNRLHQHCAANEAITACVLDGCQWVSSDCSHTSRDECRDGNCEWKYNPDIDDMACRHYQPKRAGENTCENAVFGKVKGWTVELNVPDVNNCDDCRQSCIDLGDQLSFAWRLHSKECRCYNGNIIREKDVSWWLVAQL